MHLRSLWSIFLVCILLVSCGNPSTALPTIPVDTSPAPVDGTPTSAVTITFGAFDYDRSNLQAAFTRFHEEYPNINVVITSLDDALQTTADSKGNYPADSMMNMLRRVVSVADVAPSSWVTPESFGTPLLRDLKPYMDADTSFARDDYYPTVLERFTVNGAQYILPRMMTVQALAYNKKVFTDAQLPAPAQDWSVNDLFAVAEKLTKVNNGTIERYGFYDNSGGSTALLYLLQESGIDVLSMTPRDLKAGDAKMIAVLNKYADLVKRGVIFTQMQPMYGAGNATTMPADVNTEPAEMIKSGKIAMWTDGAVYNPSGEAPQYAFDVGYATLPHGPHEDINYYMEGYVMSGGTAHPTEAWTLMEWLTRQNINPGAGGYAGYMATRKSLQAQMLPSEPADEARTAIYLYAISNMRPAKYYMSQDFSVYYMLSSAVYMVHESPPKNGQEMLAAVVKNLADNYASTAQTPSPTPDIRPVTVATPESQQASAGQTTISFASYGTSMSDMRRFVRSFKAVAPDIYVNLISTDSLTSTQTFASAANRSDCFAWNMGIPINESDRALLADMQPLIDNDPSIEIDDIPPALLDMYRGDGRLVGFPNSYTTRALVYQDQLFKKLGLEAPQASWSSDDFLKAAKALTNDDTYGYSSMGNYVGDLVFWSNRFGGNLMTGSSKELRANYTDPNVEKAITWWLALATVHKVMPMPSFDYKRGGNPIGEKSWELQAQGKIGMWLDAGNPYANTTTTDPNIAASPFTAMMAPPPIGSRGLVSADINMTGYHIAASASNPQACMTLISYLSRQANTISYGNIPARKSVSNDAIFAEQNAYAVPLRDTMAPLIEQSLTITTDASNAYMLEPYWLYQALDNIILKKADVRLSLSDAQTKTNKYMECIATIDGSSKSPTYASCAKKADANYEGYMSDEVTP